MTRLLGFLLLVCAVFSAGCASFPGGVAASNTPLHNRPYSVIGNTRGSDGHYAILGLIPITSGNSVRDAIEDAQRRIGADALIDISIDSYTQFWILFTRTVTEVHAKGIRLQPKWEGNTPDR